MSPLFGPRAETVQSRGTPAKGTLVGIRVRLSHDDPPLRIDEYAVAAGGTTYGVRQRLAPEHSVRLGMPVDLRVDGSAAVIEWGETNTFQWKPVTAPSPGIEDDTNGLRAARAKWTPTSITLGEVTKRSVLMGLGSVNDLAVVVTPTGQDPYETVLKNVEPAHYAAHLFAPGSVVSGWVNPSRLDTVLIDWAASALASPGVGAASAVPAAPEPAIDVDQPLPGFLKKLGMTSTAPGDVDDPVSFDTFVAVFRATGNGTVQGADADAIAVAHGIAAGEWDAVQTRWMSRIAKDMKLGMAFGQALNG